MNKQSLSAALMLVGLLAATPTFAQSSTTQTPTAQKQKTQESYAPAGPAYNANPSYNPTKQPTQEGGLTVSEPYTNATAAAPWNKQR